MNINYVKGAGGFTLIELTIAVTLMGTMASFASTQNLLTTTPGLTPMGIAAGTLAGFSPNTKRACEAAKNCQLDKGLSAWPTAPNGFVFNNPVASNSGFWVVCNGDLGGPIEDNWRMNEKKVVTMMVDRTGR